MEEKIQELTVEFNKLQQELAKAREAEQGISTRMVEIRGAIGALNEFTKLGEKEDDKGV